MRATELNLRTVTDTILWVERTSSQGEHMFLKQCRPNSDVKDHPTASTTIENGPHGAREGVFSIAMHAQGSNGNGLG